MRMPALHGSAEEVVRLADSRVDVPKSHSKYLAATLSGICSSLIPREIYPHLLAGVRAQLPLHFCLQRRVAREDEDAAVVPAFFVWPNVRKT